MVFFFYPKAAGPSDHQWLIYMGKDKVENEDLIRYGLQEDVWCAACLQVEAAGLCPTVLQARTGQLQCIDHLGALDAFATSCVQPTAAQAGPLHSHSAHAQLRLRLVQCTASR